VAEVEEEEEVTTAVTPTKGILTPETRILRGTLMQEIHTRETNTEILMEGTLTQEVDTGNAARQVHMIIQEHLHLTHMLLKEDV